MRTIYLIRHGLPMLDTRQHYCLGHTEYPLSQEGKQQIIRVRNYLKDKNIDRVFCSPLHRCRSSAEIISGGVIPVLEAEELKEINMGQWDGLTFSEIKEKYPREYELRGLDFGSFVPPGGENFIMCQQRAVRTFLEIAESREGNIAIVAHAGINRALISWLKSSSINDIFSIPQPYGCLNIITGNKGEYVVDKIGFIPQNEVEI